MHPFVAVTLVLCVLWALIGPLVSEKIEKRLERFMLAMGVTAVTVSWSWSEAVLLEALLRPMKVCGALLLGCLVFSFTHDHIRRGVRRAMGRMDYRLAAAAAVTLLALSACVLTTVIATLALVEVLSAMELERGSELRVAVLGCFAIGLASGLTSIAGPIPAVAVAKLSQAAYEVDKMYLWSLLSPWLVPAMLGLGVLTGVLLPKTYKARKEPLKEDPLTLWHMLVLTTRMYVFIAGLVLLGAGLVPLIDQVLLGAPPWLLYWLNSVSAVVDGATLASVELSPRMSQEQLRYTLLAIIMAGGALITGNAHNLVAAHRLAIPAKRWAAVGAPVAGVLMAFYFLSLLVY